MALERHATQWTVPESYDTSGAHAGRARSPSGAGKVNQRRLAACAGQAVGPLLSEAERATMKSTDTLDIAIALAEKHPDVDPLSVRFTDLFKWVNELDGFDDDPKRCGEKILEAIQTAWIDEVE